MTSNNLWIMAGVSVIFLGVPPGLNADTMGLLDSPLVDHPVYHPAGVRTPHRWRVGVGAWGEKLAEEMLRQSGYDEIYEIKNGGNNGFDRVAVKRDASGKIVDPRFVEVKTTRSAMPRLNRTRYGGRQMSRSWMVSNFRRMRDSGNPDLKKLAAELGRYRRTSGLPIESMGEIIHINTETGRIIGYSADGRTVRYVESAERVLKQARRQSNSAHVRKWASRSLIQGEPIRTESMSSWLGKNVAQQNMKALLRASGKGVGAAESATLRQSGRMLTRKILQRSAGPIAIVVSLAFDAKDLYDTESAYRNGAISVRQRNIRILTTLGGAAGAFAGASAGGAAGAWLGAMGGPFAWITVPAGGFLGVTIGGIGGYLGGSTVAEYGATAWYRTIDASVREKFERAWLTMQLPNF